MATHQQHFESIFQLTVLEKILVKRRLLHQPLTQQEQRDERQERRDLYNRTRISIQYANRTATIQNILRYLHITAIEINGFCQLRIQHRASNLIKRTIGNFRDRMANNNQQALIDNIGQLVATINGQVQLGHPPAQAREVNMIKIETFDGTSDPVTWLENFEKAAMANSLTDARKLAVVPAYLTGTAAA